MLVAIYKFTLNQILFILKKNYYNYPPPENRSASRTRSEYSVLNVLFSSASQQPVQPSVQCKHLASFHSEGSCLMHVPGCCAAFCSREFLILSSVIPLQPPWLMKGVMVESSAASSRSRSASCVHTNR